MHDYVNFCMDTVVSVRIVRCFAYNKPWVTSDIEDLLNKKRRSFRAWNQEELRCIQQELKLRSREAKDAHRRKVEKKTTGKQHKRGLGQHDHHRIQVEEWK